MTETKDFMLMDFALTLGRIASGMGADAEDAARALERWKDQEHLWKARGGERR